MKFLSPIIDLWHRVGSYPPFAVAFELILIWVLVYAVVRFAQGTRAAGALKGLLVLLIIITVVSRVVGGGAFQRLALLHDRFLALTAIALIIIFQPELRRALVRLGETPFFRGTPSDLTYIVEQIADACAYLTKAKFGAIMAIERQVAVAGLVEGGTAMNAELSSSLLQTIFFPGSALHDLAVIIRGRTIHSAGVQLPLAEPEDMPDSRLGSRHRAAVGLSKECDALVIVVSEEVGKVRIAERGRLSDPMSADDLRVELRSRLERASRSAQRALASPGTADDAEEHADHPESTEKAA